VFSCRNARDPHDSPFERPPRCLKPPQLRVHIKNNRYIKRIKSFETAQGHNAVRVLHSRMVVAVPPNGPETVGQTLTSIQKSRISR
jgi:hypothetical protein